MGSFGSLRNYFGVQTVAYYGTNLMQINKDISHITALNRLTPYLPLLLIYTDNLTEISEYILIISYMARIRLKNQEI